MHPEFRAKTTVCGTFVLFPLSVLAAQQTIDNLPRRTGRTGFALRNKALLIRQQFREIGIFREVLHGGEAELPLEPEARLRAAMGDERSGFRQRRAKGVGLRRDLRDALAAERRA